MKRLSLLVLALGTLATRSSFAQEPPAAAEAAPTAPAAPSRVEAVDLDPTTAAASEAPPAFVSLAGDVSKT